MLRLELGDRACERVALTAQCIGMTAGLPGLDVSQWRLRDQRPEPGIVSLVFQEDELLVGHGQLGARTLEPIGDVEEAAFEV